MTGSYTHSGYEAGERAVELVAADGETEANEKYVVKVKQAGRRHRPMP